MVLDDFKGLTWISYIDEHDLPKVITDEDVLAPSGVDLYDRDSVALEVFVFLVHFEAVILFFSVSVIHPKLSESVADNNKVLT